MFLFSGKFGLKIFVVKWFLFWGEKEKDGVMVIELNCMYFWVFLVEIDFFVGVVVFVLYVKD